MLTIGQVASRTGLRVSAIRYYESRGLLPKASRIGGTRVYEQSVLERLAIIELAKTAGFRLDEIVATLSNAGQAGPAARWKTVARAKHHEVDAEMKRLKITKHVLSRMSACSCATLEDCGRAFLDAVANHQAEPPTELKAQRRRSAKRLKPRSR
jgi:MerR family transcriptional regulator, redox-sensitive transcriptional activator SoxR